MKRIKMCYVHKHTPHNEGNHYVEQVCANQNKDQKLAIEFPKVITDFYPVDHWVGRLGARGKGQIWRFAFGCQHIRNVLCK